MTYRLPPLKALRAFEAAARHQSFKHAAVELCVTAGAVSQQVKSLENSLGISLFNRLSNGLVLTLEGESYLESISEAFAVISSATDKISSSLKSREYRLGIALTLSEEFRNRIKQLQQIEKTGFAIEISKASDLQLISKGNLDAMLRPRIKSHPGLHLDQLEYLPAKGDAQHLSLALMPGNAGCREHRLLLKMLKQKLGVKSV